MTNVKTLYTFQNAIFFFRNIRHLALNVLLLLGLAMGHIQGQVIPNKGTLLANDLNKTKNQQLQQGEVPIGLNADEWASIQKQMEMSKYKAYPQEKGGYTSANLAHGLQIAYSQEGNTVLTPRNTEEADYQIAMQLEGIGYQELTSLSTPKTLKQEDLGAGKGSKVSYQWNDNLSEWWINEEKGLEQWFSLQHAPEGRNPNSPLHLRMAFQTDMQVAQQGNRLTLKKGNTTLHYDKLKVWDATGREIQAEMHYTAGYLDFYITDREATYPLLIDPTWSQQAYLKASNTDAGDQFGFSVAISGETIVVGAFGERSNATGVNGIQTDNSAFRPGAAYVFIRSGAAWSQQAYLKASNTEAEDNFGWSVAISGETIVVGAYLEDGNETGGNGIQTDNGAVNSGAAYVFVRSGTAWSQQAYLKASNTGANDVFGFSVAISGETIVVGAEGEDSNAIGVGGVQTNNSVAESGAAYVFVRSGVAWSQQAYLKASSTGSNDYFGESVAISGETIVVGAYGEDSNARGVDGNETDNGAVNSGAAYVFVRSGTAWSQQAYLKASNTGAFDKFGGSVAISGETIVVGAEGEGSNATGVNGDQANNSAARSGAAYVFVRSGVAWSQQAYLKASSTGSNDQFGISVAISGETIVVGANREDSNARGVNGNETDNGAIDSGAAYVFVRSGAAWSQQAYIKASNTGQSDDFGISVAISGETIVVGAFQEDSNATGVNGIQADNSVAASGAAYVFRVLPAPEINLQGGSPLVSILDGDATPIPTDNTDFGSVAITKVVTYTIQNTGNAVLNITSIVSSGTDASNFVVSGLTPASPIAANSFATFTVTFTPVGLGTKTATITINNNDADEGVYDFAVQGTGVVSSGDVFLVEANTNFTTIQAAVNAAVDGNTIRMTVDRPYPENVVVSKTLTFTSNATTYQTLPINRIQMNGVGKTLTIDGNMCLTELLDMQNGNVIVTSTANFALRSTITGTAMVINAAANTVVGNVIAERYLPSVSDLAGGYDAQGYHMFSSPFSNAAISQFGDDMNLVLNTAFNTAVEPTYTNPFPTFYEYNETSAGTPSPSGIFNAFTMGYKVPTTANLQVGKGYEANIATGVTVDLNGTLNNGTISIPITHQGLVYANQGFNLIGNLYPSPINWTTLIGLPGNSALINNAVYIDIPTSQYGATYATFINGVPVNGGKADIAPFQGFFVQAIAAGNLSITNAVRPSVYQDTRFYRTDGENGEKGAKEGLIKLAIEQDGKLDETAIYFERGATQKFDGKFDALKIHKINGSTPTLYSYNEGIEENGTNTYFSINGLKEFNEDMILPLAMNIVKSGKHKIVVREIKYFHSLSNVYLYDSLTETLHDLKANPEYEFVATASREVKRFVILFKTNKTFTQKDHIVVYPNPMSNNFSYSLKNDREGVHTVRLFDATGKLILERTEEKQGAFLEGTINLEKHASGLYLLQISDSKNTTNVRVVKE
jgi:hypothetical protein